MCNPAKRRRILAVVRPDENEALSALFLATDFGEWDLFQAASFREARFTMQFGSFDAVLIDESLFLEEGNDSWEWLAAQAHPAIVLLVESAASASAAAFAHGVALCVSRATLDEPAVFSAALRRVAESGAHALERARLRQEVQESNRQLDVLVSRLWQTLPGDPRQRWYTQRHAMERLEEEVTRTARHNCSLSIALVEVKSDEDDHATSAWASDQIGRLRRRYDAAGHYGLRGFLLLLPHTSKEGGVACCERLCAALERQAPPHGSGPVRACFGVSAFSPQTATLPALLRQAEQNLATALSEGGERVVGD